MWGGFSVFFIVLLFLDLFVFNPKDRAVKVKEALLFTAFWISLALLFNLGVYCWRGPHAGLTFLTGYLLEYSLSVDNLFVFLLIFSYFQVPPVYQRKVLFWGIIGAQVMRAFFILTGVTLIHKFEWIIYIFGAFLIFTGFKLAFESEKKVQPENNPVLKLFKKLMPVTSEYEESKFFIRRNHRYYATPLFVVLLILETTDLVFAIDSIPAILAITTNAFIVYTSNMFAILGLRSLYFALAGMMRLFRFLNYGLAVILVFVGAKMLLDHFYSVPIGIALAFIAAVLTVSMIISILFPEKSGKS